MGQFLNDVKRVVSIAGWDLLFCSSSSSSSFFFLQDKLLVSYSVRRCFGPSQPPSIISGLILREAKTCECCWVNRVVSVTGWASFST